MLDLYNYIVELFAPNNVISTYIKYDVWWNGWKVLLQLDANVDPIVYEVFCIDDFENELDAYIAAKSCLQKLKRQKILWTTCYQL